jgi:hypothetical protein
MLGKVFPLAWRTIGSVKRQAKVDVTCKREFFFFY